MARKNKTQKHNFQRSEKKITKFGVNRGAVYTIIFSLKQLIDKIH